MNQQQRDGMLSSLVQYMPHDVMFYLGQRTLTPSSLPWCICGRCRPMEDRRMNVCCGNPVCVTTQLTFRNICLRADVLEVANILNWAFQFNDEPSFQPNIFRNQAYRNFVLWQWGKLGPGNRRVVPSCVVVVIRGRFPSPNGQYSGYHSSEEF